MIPADRVVVDHDLLMVLVHHEAATLIAPDPAHWRLLSATYDTAGRLDAASAVLDAYALQWMVLTAQPGLYGGLEDGGPVIPF